METGIKVKDLVLIVVTDIQMIYLLRGIEKAQKEEEKLFKIMDIVCPVLSFIGCLYLAYVM